MYLKGKTQSSQGVRLFHRSTELPQRWQTQNCSLDGDLFLKRITQETKQKQL